MICDIWSLNELSQLSRKFVIVAAVIKELGLMSAKREVRIEWSVKINAENENCLKKE